MVSRRGSSPLPCVILRDEYLFFLAALIKYGVNPEAPTTGNCFLAGGPQKKLRRKFKFSNGLRKTRLQNTNPLSHRCHGGPRQVHKLLNEQRQNWKMSQRGVVIPAGAYAPTLAEF
jgi:hypothetical protein